MEFQTILNLVLGALTGILGWFGRAMYSAVTDLKDDLYKFREQVAREYIPKNEFNQFRDELFTALRRIEDKIEKKSDK
jgi:hypothetical protein